MINKKLFVIPIIFISLLVMPLVSAYVWNSSLDVGLKEYWTFDESSGTNIFNFKNSSGNLTTTGGPAHVSGVIGNSLELNYPNPNTEYARRNSAYAVTGNWSLSFWTNLTSATGIFIGNAAGSSYVYFSSTTGLNLNFPSGTYTATIKNSNNAWSHYIVTYDYDNSVVNVYQNGTLVGTGGVLGNFTFIDYFGTFAGFTAKLEGRIDETAIWNRTLSGDEAMQLNNGMAGISPVGSKSVTLVSPANNEQLFPSNQTFIVNSNGNTNFVKNISLFINKTGSWVRNQTVILSGTNINETNNFGLNITENSIFDWSAESCYDDGTCLFAAPNRTAIFNNFIQTNITYNSITIEGSTESFILSGNISSLVTLSSANLVYNGTSYAATWNSSGIKYTISQSLFIPDTSVNTTKNFYYNLIFSNGDVYNTTNYNQTIYFLAMDNCSTYAYMIYNYTLKDEESQSILDGVSENNSMQLDLSLYPSSSLSSILNFSWDYNKTTSALVCLNINLSSTTYKVDSVMRYKTTNRVPEFYNIQKATISSSNVPQNISLFDLLTASSTEFIITFKDDNLLPVEGALIEIMRKYVSDGKFRTVELPITDISGKAKGHFDTNGVIYAINVIKDGIILASYNNVVVSCNNILIGDCTIPLNQLTSTSSFTNYSNNKNIVFNLSMDRVSRNIYFIYSTLNGSVSTIKINATKFDMFENQTICTDTLTSSAGTLICNVPTSFGNSTAIIRVYVDGSFLTQATYYFGQKPRDYFGDDLIVAIIVIALSLALMLAPDPVIMLISTVFTTIIAVGLLLISGGSIIGIGSFVVYWCIVVGILIYKINKIRGGG